MLGPGTPLEKALNMNKLLKTKLDEIKYLDPIIGDIVNRIAPDVIIMDQMTNFPSVELSGIPWVLVCSCNPLAVIDDERTPPCASGKTKDISS